MLASLDRKSGPQSFSVPTAMAIPRHLLCMQILNTKPRRAYSRICVLTRHLSDSHAQQSLRTAKKQHN